MDHQIDIPEEFSRAIIKHDKKDLRNEVSTGWGATTGGKAITNQYHARLTEGFQMALQGDHGGTDIARLVVSLRRLSFEVIALCTLQTVLHSIARRDHLRVTLLHLGMKISDELWAAKLTRDNPRLAARVSKAARLRHRNVGLRVASAKKAAALAGFSERSWSNTLKVKAGAFLWNVLTSSLPEVFKLIDVGNGSPEQMVTMTDHAWSVVDGALDRVIGANPVFWPSKVPPKPWDAFYGGGSHDERLNGSVSVVRTYQKETQAAVKAAIKDGTMQPTLDALNTMQAVPFRINLRVLEVLNKLVERGVYAPGLPHADIPKSPRLPADVWATMTVPQQNLWNVRRKEIRQTNQGFVGERIQFKEDMITAEAMAPDVFYTPLNLDWRGRVYGICHFNFQREDRVRALFLFADGIPISEEGLRWLKIHVANTGDFDKISKRPLEEREQWCNTYRQQITNIASAPLVHTEWMHADKPFLHLAACFELSAALAQGSSYITHLPTSYDGSCSGLQHLCAMTRAEEGAMVNLTPSTLPQDVYQVVADQTKARIEADTENMDLAKLFLEHGVDRKLVKRNVMTYSYSSKKFGMSSQQQVDTMDPLSRQVLDGRREEHPFEGYQHGSIERPSKAARFIASTIFDAIETRIHKPAEAMKFLQTLAKVLAHEGKPVSWTTPTGLPWINRYHEPDVAKVQLFLNEGGVKVRTQVSVAIGSKKGIDKAKASNGVAPNFVHALDASHLLLVANAAAREGITATATVHDSFGCLAPQAARYNQVIREQFAQMYEEHDVLAEILERATADLTPANRNKLPTLPSYGPLNLKDIHAADFAFA